MRKTKKKDRNLFPEEKIFLIKKIALDFISLDRVVLLDFLNIQIITHNNYLNKIIVKKEINLHLHKILHNYMEIKVYALSLFNCLFCPKSLNKKDNWVGSVELML